MTFFPETYLASASVGLPLAALLSVSFQGMLYHVAFVVADHTDVYHHEGIAAHKGERGAFNGEVLHCSK